MRFICLFILLLQFSGLSQELPPILNFPPEVYSGGNQNWSISQGDDKLMYFANNSGLLEYNGASWTLYPTPDNSIMRSVHVIGNRVYTGSYMNFGFWEKNSEGISEYTSLNETLGVEVLEDEQIWNIVPQNKWVLFQSLNRIYIYNSENQEIKFIEAENTINKIFQVDNSIYYQVLKKGLYTIAGGSEQLLLPEEILEDKLIINMVRIEDRVALVMQDTGIYFLENDNLLEWDFPARDNLKDMEVYSCIQLKDGTVVLGTISGGIQMITENGDSLYSINQGNGLSNNTALCLFEDIEGNIWSGLDNGIDCINLRNPFTCFSDKGGRLGTTYASLLHNDYLYLGTNQGLFYKNINGESQFTLMEGTEGQVWILKEINGELFCGHNKGTFIIRGTSVKSISDVMGTWDIKPIPSHEDMLIQGNYDGLYILEKVGTDWKLRNKISGFNISSKHFELVPNNTILVSHEYKGVYSLDLTEDYRRVLSYSKNGTVNKSPNSSLVKFNDKIYYGSRDGIFMYDPAENAFLPDEELSKLYFEEQYITGKLVVSENNKLWAFSKNYICEIEKENLGDAYRIRNIPIPHILRIGMRGYENISRLSDGQYLIGTTNGYLILNLNDTTFKAYSISLTSVHNGSKADEKNRVRLDSIAEFPANYNFVNFSYHVPEYDKYLVTEYQYSLDGRMGDQWSDWSTESSISFENLPHGDYSFKVRARVGEQLTDNVAIYNFIIKTPPLLSKTAFVLYVLVLLSCFVAINWFYRRYYRKQRQKIIERSKRELQMKELASQKEIVQLKNESLQQDIESRNRELAISTMSMIKKNNILSSIKNELKRLEQKKLVSPVINLIDKTIDDSEDWELFEQAFNYADQEFFKKVKEKHPQLTPNDLRLCVYLRLNLTSKEIAPLLNISPRSVEIKRYRLRKKIELDHDVNLNDYFINL